eukprot:Em0002g1855a
MAHLCRRNFKSWKACLILVCNVVLNGASRLTAAALLSKDSSGNNDVMHVLARNTNILLNSTAVLYIIVGILADIRFGRYKVVAYSIFISFALLLASSAASLISTLSRTGQDCLLWISISAYIAHFIALTSFQGTILHFGLDQLSEASSDELSSFIHWFVWTIIIAESPLIYIPTNTETCIVFLTISMVISAGMLILCLALCRGARGCNIQFIREPPSRSPYTSVFKVLQFAKNHKTPLHRSALTYWEDGPPSRLDMGKDKYGGPFTNEQVEDVKTFFRLLYSLACILFMYFLLSISFREEFVLHFGREQQSSYSLQPKDPIYLITAHIFYSPIFATALLIPLHELVLHPLLGNRYLPNMMTKMKIAGILISASLAINLIIDGVGHYRQNVQCMFAAYTNATPLPGQLQAIDISPFILIVPGLMVDLAFPLLYISFLEFTVAQAPYPMRGMMIGFAYFFVGLFTILGAGYQRIFMSLALLSSWPGRYSCCTLYYTIGATVSLLVTVLTFWTTHKYKFRERSEVINEYQFIENYYSAHSN